MAVYSSLKVVLKIRRTIIAIVVVSMEILDVEITIEEDMARKYLKKVMFSASFFRSMVTLLMNATSRNIQMNMRQKLQDKKMMMITSC
jgi:hypothetical protein